MSTQPYPDHSGLRHYVYRIFDADSRLIYVGCSHDMEKRIYSHRQLMWWAPQIDRIKITVHPNKKAAHEVEREIIRTEKPRWNLVGKWSGRASWTAEDCRDFITAHLNCPNHITEPRARVITKARNLLSQLELIPA